VSPGGDRGRPRQSALNVEPITTSTDAVKGTATGNTAASSRAGFQVLPPLDPDELAALETDIAERGVVVPVVLDQHGRLLDGHHRRDIAARLGIECPTDVVHVVDDEDARRRALALNLARRHLSREQRRELIAAEIVAAPEDSDRAIARRLGVDHKTVGAVRLHLSGGEIPHPKPVRGPAQNLSADQQDAIIEAIARARPEAIARVVEDQPTLQERVARQWGVRAEVIRTRGTDVAENEKRKRAERKAESPSGTVNAMQELLDFEEAGDALDRIFQRFKSGYYSWDRYPRDLINETESVLRHWRDQCDEMCASLALERWIEEGDA
jgi:ParB-like chromosome segregation protein Spo0J